MKTSPPIPLVDSHVHVWAPESPRYPWSDELSGRRPYLADVDRLLVEMDAAGVAQAVIVQAATYAFDHRYALDCLDQHPARFSCVVMLDPRDPASPRRLASLARNPRVSGVQFIPLVAPDRGWLEETSDELCVHIAEVGLTLGLLVRPEQLPQVESLIARHPSMTVVIDHMGRPDLLERSGRDAVAALCRLSRIETVHVKISALPILSAEGFPHRDTWVWIREVLDAFGPERCMWGSDWPMVTERSGYPESLDVIRQALVDLDGAQLRSLLCGTARRLYRLP